MAGHLSPSNDWRMNISRNDWTPNWAVAFGARSVTVPALVTFYKYPTMAGVKRKAELEVPVADENDLLKLTPLGAGNEVGRSSILLEYKGKTVLVGWCFHSWVGGECATAVAATAKILHRDCASYMAAIDLAKRVMEDMHRNKYCSVFLEYTNNKEHVQLISSFFRFLWVL